MLNKEDIQEFQKSLEAEKARLLTEIGKDSVPQNFGNDIDAGDSRTDETEEFANQLAEAQTLRDRANEIEDALNRIANGTYGVCVECGGPISKETLKVAPESALCSNCKK